ncbi:MAG: hypothetical protein SFV15_11695 [Polyangiaceae bacterium]|nr:hypothetical protein [Polyangiaceae bacterium]
MVTFDIDAAVLSLNRAAIAAGAIPDDDERQPGPTETAEFHLHGYGSTTCTKSPCRAAGLCHALYEVVQYRREAANEEIIEAADATELMRKAFRKYGDKYMKTLEALSARSDQRHRQLRALGRKEPRSEHETLCRLPERAIIEMSALRSTLEELEERLRGYNSSFELQQSRDKRSADLLLTAVYQHLRWGGLTYSEIARLVPDGRGSRGEIARIRDRIKSPNQRSMMPRELLGQPRRPGRKKARAKAH